MPEAAADEDIQIVTADDGWLFATLRRAGEA